MTAPIRSALRSADLRHIAWLASGTALAQLISVAILPLVTRLYTPAEFGVFAIYMAVASILSVMGAGRYEEAIILARRDAEAVRLVVLCLAMTLGTAAATALALGGVSWILPRPLPPAFGNVAELILWLPLTLLAAGTLQTLTVWCNRAKQYRRISGSQLTRSIVAAAGKLGGGMAGLGSTGLIGGAVLGHLVAAAAMATQVARGHGAEFVQGAYRSLRWRRIVALARRYRAFPLYSLPRMLLNTAAMAMPGLLFAIMLGPVAAGLYWFVYRLMQMPLALSGASVNRVVYRRAAELSRRNESLVPLMRKVMLGLGLAALPPAVALMLWGPELFGLVFGAEWRHAGTYTQWLAGWWLVRMAATPAFTFIPVLNLQQRLLALEAGALALRCLAVVLGARLGGDVQAVAAFSLVSVVYNLGVIALVLAAMRHPRIGSAPVPTSGI